MLYILGKQPQLSNISPNNVSWTNLRSFKVTSNSFGKPEFTWKTSESKRKTVVGHFLMPIWFVTTLKLKIYRQVPIDMFCQFNFKTSSLTKLNVLLDAMRQRFLIYWQVRKWNVKWPHIYLVGTSSDSN